MLSNLYLHHVLDQWFEQEVKPRLRGRAFEIRFADDAALVFEREEDARRVLAVLAKRFARYGLRLHPEKTRLVDFRRPSQAARSGSQSERSFTLLGFTHYWGRSRKGRWVVQRKTERNRFTRAVRAVGQWCRTHRHWSLADQQAAPEPQAARPLRLLRHYRQRTRFGAISSRSPPHMAQVAESPLVAHAAELGSLRPSDQALPPTPAKGRA